VIAWVERQYGVISRAQLLALGVPSRTIQGWRLAGLLHDLHPGVYAWGHGAVSWEGRCMAAQLAGGEGAVVSHASAAALHGLLAARPTVDVISAHRRAGGATLRVHRGSLHADEIDVKQALRITTIERTLFDVPEPWLITEAIAKGRTTIESLHDFAGSKFGVRGSLRFARAVGLPQYRSRFERDFHRWLRRSGFPEATVNDKVGRRTFDFVWWRERVIVETDGPHHRTPGQRANDERADAEAGAHGFCVVRVAQEGFGARQDHVSALIRAALAAD
jgi:very-short-patch-repair endonuclease